MSLAPALLPAVAAPVHRGCALHSQAHATASPCTDEDHGTPGHRCPGEGPVRDIVRRYALIDELLDARRRLFGGDEAQAVFTAYRNHAYHILNFARQWAPASPVRDDKLAIAAVFHDIAAWPDDNLDYLRPSADQALAYLDSVGLADWKPEMRLMVEMHHKITAYRGAHADWVEPVRRADWCDISFATMRFGLPKTFVDEVRREFPIGAFYPAHVSRVSLKWLLRHPLNPVPILRW